MGGRDRLGGRPRLRRAPESTDAGARPLPVSLAPCPATARCLRFRSTVTWNTAPSRKVAHRILRPGADIGTREHVHHRQCATLGDRGVAVDDEVRMEAVTSVFLRVERQADTRVAPDIADLAARSKNVTNVSSLSTSPAQASVTCGRPSWCNVMM